MTARAQSPLQVGKLLAWFQAHFAAGEAVELTKERWGELVGLGLFTIHRELETLQQTGLVERVDTNTYALTEEGADYDGRTFG